MKRHSVLLATGLAALLVAALVTLALGQAMAPAGGAAAAAAPAKGKEVTLTGKLSCTVCSMAHPDTPCPPGCCESCIKAGDPPLFTDKDGNQYILATSEMKGTLMTPERLKMAGSTVKISGMLMTGKGVQVITVKTMEKAEDAAKPAAPAAKPADAAKPAAAPAK